MELLTPKWATQEIQLLVHFKEDYQPTLSTWGLGRLIFNSLEAKGKFLNNWLDHLMVKEEVLHQCNMLGLVNSISRILEVSTKTIVEAWEA